MNIFAPVPKICPSALNSSAGDTTEFAKPEIGTKHPAPPIFANLSNTPIIVRIAVILIGSYTVYKLLAGSLTLAVGVAMLGAFFGALAADIYLLVKIKHNKEKLNLERKYKKDNISNKEIIKKMQEKAIQNKIITPNCEIIKNHIKNFF